MIYQSINFAEPIWKAMSEFRNPFQLICQDYQSVWLFVCAARH